MSSDSGHTTSIWMATADVPAFPALGEDTHADVCVVGAGIAGLTTAYLLGREGKKVVVLDDGPIGGGETGRTTAHLASALDEGFAELERLHGEAGAKLAAESHAAAIDRIEAIVHADHADCDFERLDGFLFHPPGEATDKLDRELEAANRAGLHAERLERAPLSGFETGPCLRFPRQAQFHPLRYLSALAAAITRDGGRIFTATHVAKVKGGKPGQVTTGSGRVVTADAVVVATNSPINDMLVIHTKQAAYRSYVIGASIPAGAVPRALYWDTLDPYHYVRLQRTAEAHELLIVGGEDHKTGQADDAEERFGRLAAWMRERFPLAGPVAIRWSGQVLEPVDGLAFIGRNPRDEPNVFIATGDSGHGMTHGTIAGILLTDLILGRENPWATLYDPSRISLRAVKDFATENLNVAARFVELVTPGDVRSAEEIAPGSGAVLRSGLTKVAAYRDPAGTLHRCSAICPHLKCVVHWNTAESSWDCPCHGSRFDPLGKVLNGPANRDLAPLDPD